ncbi:50S ribosomal protein L13 [Candidatus Berkelbacteria bacterium RIFOXYA2_FULL_43_10]|uniref:Large ribosomal subunit protein uL13 n=1 Tax=Candidatus Berkelbacteria bacterium RIFOXYA2_FULL_43_10 TaxID=1797472 RepID=A0A1F5EAQ7_9BACT|nr:MAG: 50S ribosomal protein L13 [Candidatus Berkelbacteria bacterium RIFOXYA2_FULL_43_10]
MEKEPTQNRSWHIVDCKSAVLGRISTQIADLLRGKKKIGFRQNLDSGAYVVAINAASISVSGSKAKQMRYYKHTGYIGNLKTSTYSEVLESNPEKILLHAVKGMLTKNKIAKDQIKRLKIYRGSIHPHKNIKFKD